MNSGGSACGRLITLGVSSQTWKLIEEIGELLTEIAREHTGRGDKDSIREELADTTVMCEQMRIIYGGSEVDEWIDRKLARLEEKIGGENG